jgi:hypothetical protein
MRINIHEHLIVNGYLAGEPVDRALYWATRIASNLEGVSRYDAARRQLLVIFWECFRVIRDNQAAVDRNGIHRLVAWRDDHLHRFSEKQMVDGRELDKHITQLVDHYQSTAETLGSGESALFRGTATTAAQRA